MQLVVAKKSSADPRFQQSNAETLLHPAYLLSRIEISNASKETGARKAFPLMTNTDNSGQPSVHHM